MEGRLHSSVGPLTTSGEKLVEVGADKAVDAKDARLVSSPGPLKKCFVRQLRPPSLFLLGPRPKVSNVGTAAARLALKDSRKDSPSRLRALDRPVPYRRRVRYIFRTPKSSANRVVGRARRP